MMSRRPAFPVGYSLGGYPAIERPDHVDDRYELYSLGQGDNSETFLLLVRLESYAPLSSDQFVAWWGAQPSSVLRGFQVASDRDSPAGSIAAMLHVQGRRISELNLANATQETLRNVFQLVTDYVADTANGRMSPDLSPDATWIGTPDGALCSLLPVALAALEEPERVRLAADGFFRLATGLSPNRIGSAGRQKLSSWARNAGEQLSSIVDRCLARPGSRSGIVSLAALESAIGVKSRVLESTIVPAGDAVAPSSAGRGLDRVGGMHDLKAQLRRDVVGPIRDPEPFRRYGLSIPNGILLFGPPGCGKTYIARQLAEELGHHFVEIIPSEVVGSYVHQTVNRIRELFDSAERHAPAIIFIDEFEALVPSREGLGGHQQYKAEEVNEFLAHLNSCAEKGIFVIAATNRPEKIDAAVRRTGRLDKLIYVGPPDCEARREMLGLHLSGRPTSTDLDLAALAERTVGYSASDIRFLVDEASREALRTRSDISEASFRTAAVRVRPSVPPEQEVEYRSIEERG